MRVLSEFALNAPDGDVTGLVLTWDDGETREYAYPEDTGGDADGGKLGADLADTAASEAIKLQDDDTEVWYREWLFVDEYLLDGRTAAPPIEDAAEVSAGGSELSSALDEPVPEPVPVPEPTPNPKPKRRKAPSARLREGAGCKQPDEVNGWIANRLLCVTKTHRGKPWGRCEYRVRCEKNGSYTLEVFNGSRSDIAQGDNWATASVMFKKLLGLPPETVHHKMTIKRFFRL